MGHLGSRIVPYALHSVNKSDCVGFISIPTALETHESMGINGDLSPAPSPWLFCP
jgi:hypothetical protein